MVKLHLYHGFPADPGTDTDTGMDSWGVPGPWLTGKWLVATRMSEITLGGLDKDTVLLCHEEHPRALYHDGANGWCLDLRVEDGCIRFGDMLFGDWQVVDVAHVPTMAKVIQD